MSVPKYKIDSFQEFFVLQMVHFVEELLLLILLCIKFKIIFISLLLY